MINPHVSHLHVKKFWNNLIKQGRHFIGAHCWKWGIHIQASYEFLYSKYLESVWKYFIEIREGIFHCPNCFSLSVFKCRWDSGFLKMTSEIAEKCSLYFKIYISRKIHHFNMNMKQDCHAICFMKFVVSNQHGEIQPKGCFMPCDGKLRKKKLPLFRICFTFSWHRYSMCTFFFLLSNWEVYLKHRKRHFIIWLLIQIEFLHQV